MAMNRMSHRRRAKIEEARNKAYGKRWRRLWAQRKSVTVAEQAALARMLSKYIHRDDPITLRMGYSTAIPRREYDAAVDVFDLVQHDLEEDCIVHTMKDRYKTRSVKF